MLRLLVLLLLGGGLIGAVHAQNEGKPTESKPVSKPKTEAKSVKPQSEVKAAEKTPAALSSENKSKADPRLVNALKAAGYKFEETDRGVLKLFFDISDGRSQQVFVASQTQKTGALETRKIWSTAMKSQDALAAPMANKLLMDSDKVAFGGWELVKWPDGYRVLFVAAVPADLSSDGLKTAIRMVFSKADSMEKELTGEDRF
jgi:hypothetical protein